MITTELFALGLVVKLLLEFFSKREERASISKTFTLPTPFEEDVVNFLVKFMRPSCSRGCFWIPNLVFWNYSTLCAFLSGMKRSKTIFVLVFLHISGHKGEAKSRNRPISDSSLTPAPIKSLSSRDLEMKFNSPAQKTGEISLPQAHGIEIFRHSNKCSQHLECFILNPSEFFPLKRLNELNCLFSPECWGSDRISTRESNIIRVSTTVEVWRYPRFYQILRDRTRFYD